MTSLKRSSGLKRKGASPSAKSEASSNTDVGTDFIWGVGIESSTLPHLDVDQFEWTQHNRCWRQDLEIVSGQLGLKSLRYAIPWEYTEPRPGHFDWRIADERINACRELGLKPILDIMHFGTPRWLPQAVGDPEFPEALERLTVAMVERYRGSIDTWCPINEPLVTSLFSGDFGFWPPHARKWRGYMPVLGRVAMAISRSIRAIRRLQPEAQVLICDAADHFRSRDESLAAEVALRNLRRFLLLDLISGRVDARHPLREWVIAYGMSELDLQWHASHPQQPDIIGLDYYPHSNWQLERGKFGLKQRRADGPAGLYTVASEFYNRYGLPMILSETSIEGKPINREVWLDQMASDSRRLRSEGIPLMGIIWWPLFDHLDWDGALTHRVGKLHRVGLYKLVRQNDGTLERVKTPLADAYAKLAAGGTELVGELDDLAVPIAAADEEMPPLSEWMPVSGGASTTAFVETGSITKESGLSARVGANGGNGHGNGHGARHASAALPTVALSSTGAAATVSPDSSLELGNYGILVFSHLRWGFVWQRPQQFLSRLARTHAVLFVEEPMFDLGDGEEPRVELHSVMPNVTVACPHLPPADQTKPDIASDLVRYARWALEQVNGEGSFDRPLLWYYSPMDSSWSLDQFENRGVVYDCMDELSQFSGAPPELIQNEARLMAHADVVFTGGQNLWDRKRQQHPNVHFFGCGVEVDHFGLAADPGTPVPPDIDFMPRPIIGWFGVIDERVDYGLVAEMANRKPDWSFAMLGPVVKVDPNLLPHAPNLFWLGGRDYSLLPNYCRAFDACMMCFAINKATEFINPTKALEYLATGKPVVSTPVKDVVAQYADLMEIAATPAEFIAALERALHAPDVDRIQRGLKKAAASSWESTVAQMEKLILQAINSDDRPSRKPIAPVSDAAARSFVPTQGS